MKRFVPAAVLVCAAIVAVPALGAKAQTINLLEVQTVFVGAGGFDGTAPPKVGQGFVVGSDYYKWDGSKRGARFGTLDVSCVFVTNPQPDGSKTVCPAVASLPGGRITASGLIPDAHRFTIAIVGGTGRYLGAQGYVEVTNGIGGENTNKANDKLVITG
jgi:hypothetical protein